MKKLHAYSAIVIAITMLLLGTIDVQARAYGVTRGGRAYAVGPRGAAVRGPYGGAAVGRAGRYAVAGRGGYYAAGRRYAPAGPYVRMLPRPYRPVFYRGYNCYLVGGVYYRPAFYGGETVYIVVN